MNAHTQGPWEIDVDNYHAGHIASVSTADGPGPRFEVWSMNWPKPEQCEANARLIAAAPDLLAALDRIEEEASVEEVDPDDCRETIIKIARAAIDKALGR